MKSLNSFNYSQSNFQFEKSWIHSILVGLQYLESNLKSKKPDSDCNQSNFQLSNLTIIQSHNQCENLATLSLEPGYILSAAPPPPILFNSTKSSGLFLHLGPSTAARKIHWRINPANLLILHKKHRIVYSPTKNFYYSAAGFLTVPLVFLQYRWICLTVPLDFFMEWSWSFPCMVQTHKKGLIHQWPFGAKIYIFGEWGWFYFIPEGSQVNLDPYQEFENKYKIDPS